MILVNVELKCTPKKKKEILQTLEGLAGYMVENRVCIQTRLYQDVEDEEILYFIGEWNDEADFNGKSYEKFMTVLGGFGTLLQEPVKVNKMLQRKVVEQNLLCSFGRAEIH